MNETLELVNGLTDSEVVTALKELYNTAYSQINYEEVLNNSSEIPELEDILKIDDSKKRSELTANESIQLSRNILQNFAVDPRNTQVLKEICEKVKDQDELFIGAVVAVGRDRRDVLDRADDRRLDPDAETRWRPHRPASRHYYFRHRGGRAAVRFLRNPAGIAGCSRIICPRSLRVSPLSQGASRNRNQDRDRREPGLRS